MVVGWPMDEIKAVIAIGHDVDYVIFIFRCTIIIITKCILNLCYSYSQYLVKITYILLFYYILYSIRIAGYPLTIHMAAIALVLHHIIKFV